MIAKKFKANIAECIQKRPTLTKKGPFFATKIFPNTLSYSRFGVVIGKKVDKRATERNRIRRMFYRVIRERNLSEQGGYDVMIMVFPEIKQFSNEDILKTLHSAEFF